jgi:hypothetical protein
MPHTLLETHRHPKYPRLALDLRADSRFYQARTYLDGKVRLKSTKTEALPAALKIAEDWYRRELRASVAFGKQHPIARLTTDPTVAEMFASYRGELEKRRRPEADKRWSPIADYWRTLRIADIEPSTFKAFYAWRRKRRKGITAHTLHKDIVTIRQVLKHAAMNGQLTGLPLIPKPGKIEANPRPWLTRDEWLRLATQAVLRIADAPNVRTKRQREDLYDFMVFMIESTMRVEELRDLTVGQMQLVEADGDEPEHLLIDVHGKRGHRVAVVGGAAVNIFRNRSKGLKAPDPLWQHGQRDAFRELLIAAGLREDAFGNERNLKSLRATAISFKILAGAPAPNLLMIARNAGTSVTMIDQFYARRLSAAMGVAELSKSTII